MRTSTRTTSAWPVALGVLSIIAGYRAMRFRGGAPRPSHMLSLMKEVSQGDFSSLTGGGLWPLVYMGASLCAAAAAIVGAVLLLRRRRFASRMHQLYAIVAIVAVVAYILAGWRVYGSFRQRREQMWVRMIYNLFTGSVEAVVYPVVVLVWFWRPAVQWEMRAWRTPAGRELSKPRQPVWPTVLGAMALLWGSTDLLAATLRLIGETALPWPVRVTNGIVRQWPLHVLLSLRVAVAALSVVWGVLMLRRKRSAVRWCRTFAVCSLALCVGTPVLSLMRGAFSRPGSRLDIIILMATSTVVGMIWPIFLLIWLARPKVRAQVKAWGP